MTEFMSYFRFRLADFENKPVCGTKAVKAVVLLRIRTIPDFHPSSELPLLATGTDVVNQLFASSFDIRGERQRVPYELAVIQILLPARNHAAAFVEFGTCEVAVGERLFELLAGVLLDECPNLLEDTRATGNAVNQGSRP
nr:hypothetical protein [Halobacterium hubeiense]